MNKTEFTQLLKKSDLEVKFVKKGDGTERTIRCSSNIPEDKLSPTGLSKIKPEKLVTVYDMDLNEWRSFYVDSIIEVKELPTSFGLLQE